MTAPARLPTRAKLFYGVGSVAYGVKDGGFGYFLLLYYNQVLGLPESWVGLGIMIALVLDAISNPVVGYISDNLHSRWGRRHPFMYASVVPVAIGYFFLWNPPAGLTQNGLFAYFLVTAVLVRICINLYEIPSASLVSELTDHYDERTSLLSYRFFFGWVGGLTMGAVSYAVFLQPDATHPVGVLNPAGYNAYGLAASVIMAGAILLSAIGTHAHIPTLKQPPPKQPFTVGRTVREVRETLSDRPFLVLLVGGVFSAMAAGLTASLNIYFNTFFWELSSDQITVLVVANFVSAAIALVTAPRLSARFGKKPAAIGVSVTAIALAPVPIVLRLLDLFPANGTPALLPTLLAINTVEVTLIIIASILVSAMVADVVEHSELTTGRRSEGVFFAVRTLVQEAVSGTGIFTSSLILGAIGFPSGAQPGEVAPGVIRTLGVVYVPALVLLYGVSVVFLAGYRISRASHERNLAELADRARG